MIRVPLTTLIGFSLVFFSAPLVGSKLDLRLRMIGFLMVYLGGVLLLLRICTLQVLAGLLVSGLAGIITLSIGHIQFSEPVVIHRQGISLISDYLTAFALLLLAYAVERKLRLWIPVPDSLLLSSLYLFFCSLKSLITSFTLTDGFIHISCILFAFTMIYLLLETSTLVFACLIAINLLIAFIGAYITVPEEIPEELS